MDKKELRRQFTMRQLLTYNTKLSGELIILRQNHNVLIKKQEQIIEKEVKARTKKYEDQIINLKKTHESIVEDKNDKIKVLEKEIAKLISLMNNDANNSSVPTSKTKIGSKKRIPNSRIKSGKSIGGQVGHKKHKLKRFEDSEITEKVSVTPKHCPKCLSNRINILDDGITKDETDYIVKVIKRRYTFNTCECYECNQTFRAEIPNNLKEENQYGSTVQSLAVCLTNEIYTPFNKVVKLITGITDNQIKLSEGYVVKLQKKASSGLESFIKELKMQLPKEKVYGWDDTVIKVNKKNACLRVYCAEDIVLFTAHDKKNAEGLSLDGILKNTTSATTVVHDHLLHNYNKKFSFNNSECLRHINTRLIKMKEDTKHTWNDDLLKLLNETNENRKELLGKGVKGFTKEQLENIYNEYDKILKKGDQQNDEDSANVFFDKEITLLKDLKKYKENYLWWCNDFDVPCTNNNSERSLRSVKSKQKISSQFKNLANARYYANIRSYIETCKRNGINIIDACARLMEGSPYTLEEVLNYPKKQKK